MSKIHYVVGFMFDQTMSKLVLIRKKKPEFQAGLLNGVGGKIEDGETPIDAMVREFDEEAGVLTRPSNWHHLLTLTTNNIVLHIFWSRFNTVIGQVFSRTDEPIVIVPSLPVRPDVLLNLQWIIPLILHRAQYPNHDIEIMNPPTVAAVKPTMWG